MQNAETKIKVLIVDDSAVIRKFLAKIIEEDPRLTVIGEASDGPEGIQKVLQLRPDIVSMDIQMPTMNGVEVTRYLMQNHPLPIVVASSFYHPSDQAIVMQVLEAGAVGIVLKPTGFGHPEHDLTAKKYLTMLRSLAEVKVVRRRMVQDVRASIASSYETPSTAIETKESTAKILAIGASAGGPEALKILLGALKKELSIPILLVQHIDANFSKGFGQWLEIHTSLKVVFCDKHQELQPGVVHLAPPDHHMVIAGSGEATLNQHPPEAGHRPSVGMLFRSASRHYGASAIGVLLSGMGSDGARDLLAMRMAGAQTYAQSKESCLVFGMPGEAVKLGAARVVDHPLNIAKYINHIVP